MVDPTVQRMRWLEECSSLQKYSICNSCNKKFASKQSLIKHFRVCDLQKDLSCEWCKITFTNRGNLVSHTMRIHSNTKQGNNTQKTGKKIIRIKCDVCDSTYTDRMKLNYHIRREHFNLMARTPYCEQKKVNQVWFEKVLNTNAVMEIKKISPNTLVMRKLGPNTAIKVFNDPSQQTVKDLSYLYPTSATKNKGKKKCKFCNKTLDIRSIQKHIDEKHRKIAKHKCNNCFRTFKRHYIFLRHICFKGRITRQSNVDNEPILKPPKKTDLRSRLLRNNLPFKSKH